MTPLLGIDVSIWQGKIIWHEVADSGHHFAAIKATEGLAVQDPTFEYNWYHARRRGLDRLAYHYLHPNFSGKQQASFLHSTVRSKGRFEPGDGVLLDLEETDGMAPNQVIACAEEFVQQILHETVAGIMLYCNYDFWVNTLRNPRSPILAKCPLWQASWYAHPARIDNWPNGPSFQQYAANGRVPGVPNQVDLDWFFGTRQILRELLTQGGRR